MSKNKKNPVRQLRESDIKRIKLEATQNAVNFSNIIFLSVMRDKEGYGVKRLKRLYDRIQMGRIKMNKIRCEKCKSRIKKIDCGTLYCAKTNPIKMVNVKYGEVCPTWCPKGKKK